MSTDPRSQLAAAARARHGVTSTAEAARLGLTARQVRTDLARGRSLQPAPGVLLAPAAAESWEQRLAIATTSARAPASHRSAGRLHRLDGCTAEVLELSVLRGRRVRRDGWVVHQVGALDPQDLTVVDGIEVTNLARTLVDLGAVIGDDAVEQALDDALRKGVR